MPPKRAPTKKKNDAAASTAGQPAATTAAAAAKHKKQTNLRVYLEANRDRAQPASATAPHQQDAGASSLSEEVEEQTAAATGATSAAPATAAPVLGVDALRRAQRAAQAQSRRDGTAGTEPKKRKGVHAFVRKGMWHPGWAAAYPWAKHDGTLVWCLYCRCFPMCRSGEAISKGTLKFSEVRADHLCNHVDTHRKPITPMCH